MLPTIIKGCSLWRAPEQSGKQAQPAANNKNNLKKQTQKQHHNVFICGQKTL
jgi:hypothetical protein